MDNGGYREDTKHSYRKTQTQAEERSKDRAISPNKEKVHTGAQDKWTWGKEGHREPTGVRVRMGLKFNYPASSTLHAHPFLLLSLLTFSWY